MITDFHEYTSHWECTDIHFFCTIFWSLSSLAYAFHQWCFEYVMLYTYYCFFTHMLLFQHLMRAKWCTLTDQHSSLNCSTTPSYITQENDVNILKTNLFTFCFHFSPISNGRTELTQHWLTATINSLAMKHLYQEKAKHRHIITARHLFWILNKLRLGFNSRCIY